MKLTAQLSFKERLVNSWSFNSIPSIHFMSRHRHNLARRRGHYLHNTQQTQDMNIHALSGIRTSDLSN